MRMKKLLVALLALTMLATGFVGNSIHIQAATDNAVTRTEDSDLIVTPGQTTHISFPIKAKKSINNPTISISAAEGAPLTFSKPTLSLYGSDNPNVYLNDTNIEFDVKVKETAEIKDYPIAINFAYSDFDIDKGGFSDITVTLNTVLRVQNEKTPAQLTVSNVVLDNSNVGSSTQLKFKVKNEGEITAKNVYLLMDYGGAMEELYTAKNIKIGDLAADDTEEITLPVAILSNAAAGKKTLVCKFDYKTSDGTPKTSSYNIYVTLKSNVSAPKLTLENADYSDGLKPGDTFNLSLVLKNTGEGTANEISATIDDASVAQDGIIKNYYQDGISGSSLKKDKSEIIKVPLKVSKYATGGMKALKVVITYKDDADASYSINETVYVDVTAASTAAGAANIVVSNVNQSPEQPSAGGYLDVSFDLENKSNVDASEIKVYATGLTSDTFIPVEAEPYQYIEKLKGGDKVRITIPLTLSKNIPEGLSNLTIKCDYAGNDKDNSIIIPIRNVKNDFGSSSKPKLIISKYTTDIDKLKAGSTFNFTYDIYNTNSSVAAKNITVTITQADNIFTVTQGSNSFFINKIGPGETVQNTIELKVKSDATTKAYPLKITIDYEYDGFVPSSDSKGETETGITKVEELNLQAVENARPVVDNVQVYSYEGNVMVGSPATISFAFYNMGKSVLSNVMVTLEGDGFTKSDGSMYFIGNVEPGSSSPVEFEAIPNMEGNVKGTLKVSYEDSNGDTVEFTKEFEGMVMAAGVIDQGAMNGETGEVFNPGIPTAKKAILPVWAFVLVQIVIFILFVPITRKIIISVYKSKLRRKEEEQY